MLQMIYIQNEIMLENFTEAKNIFLTMMADNMYYCEKCGRTMGKDQFYQSNNLQKYPTGVLHQCKKCLTMHIDNWDSSTFLPILEEIDVPWVEDEWAKLMQKYAKNPEKVTGMTILGRYLSIMKLKQWKDYRWKDNDFIQESRQAKMKNAMKQMGYSAGEIEEAISKGGTINMPEKPVTAVADTSSSGTFMPMDDDEEDIMNQLTEEDKTYLRLKWGKLYRPSEWVQLEQLYNDMMNSYDIQEAGHIDTLKLICKTSLKANQLVDLGDVEGYQKMSKVYNDLMRAGNFTAAQNKSDNGDFIDSISELVEMCEKDGFIPRFYQDQPNDKVDRTIEDMQRYTYRLVTEEMGLGNMIENALKQIVKDKEKEAADDFDDEDETSEAENNLFTYDEDIEITPEDFNELRELEERMGQEDYENLQKMLEE